MSDGNTDKMGDGGSAYRSLLGGVMYASISTRPDICHAVSSASTVMSAPDQGHYSQAKRIIRYLAGTKELGIHYSSKGENILTGYCDSDWGGDRSSRRSTTGYVFYLNGGPISWNTKRQPTVALDDSGRIHESSRKHQVQEACEPNASPFRRAYSLSFSR